MELRERLRRWAYARPRVLVVDAAGRDVLRWAVEAAIDDRGWEFATSPAGTDVLVVLGEAAPALADAIDVLWSQVPGPRSTVAIADPALVDQQLDAAMAGLVPVPATGAVHPPVPDPADRPAAAHQPSDGDVHTAQDMGEHSGHDMGGEHSGHDMGGDGGHHGHHGGVVAGLPMAQTAPDRDGLELDTLAVALGPVLPGWPTGLVLHAQLHGDVLSDVRSSWIAGVPGAPGATPHDEHQLAALDHLARFLVVAGWPAQARHARRALAGLRSTDPAVRSQAAAAAARLAGRVRRSRSLAWSVRGMGPLPARARVGSDAGRPRAGGDVLDRLRQWCDAAQQPGLPPMATVSPQALAEVVEGAELAAARLVVASVALDRVGAPSRGVVTGD